MTVELLSHFGSDIMVANTARVSYQKEASKETEFIWTGSMLAFLHLCKLRIKEDAQQETREIAQMMLEQVKAIPNNPFQHTLEAFGF